VSKQDGRDRLVSAEPVDDVSAHVLHLDLDAFYASVELLDRPELAGRPVIVGHTSPRSVVTAANYEARRYGVNSAMSMALALRRCPAAVVLEPHFDRYRHFSRVVMGMLHDVTPLVEPLSIDEAFLDVRGAMRLLGSPWRIGTRLRERILAETGLTASVGAAATKFVAKLAGARAKPDGLLVIPADATLGFLHPQPVSALWGVGARTGEQLARLGLRTIGDLAETPLDALERAIGPAGARRLHDLAWGRDPRAVEPTRIEKSIGHEVTFARDVDDAAELERVLLRLANDVGRRLRHGGVRARTVSIKVRFADFETVTRSRTIPEPTDLGRRVFEEARELLREFHGRALRLIGVRGEQLVDRGGAPALWDDDAGWRDAEAAMDAISVRFGRAGVQPASLLSPQPDRRPGRDG